MVSAVDVDVKTVSVFDNHNRNYETRDIYIHKFNNQPAWEDLLS